MRSKTMMAAGQRRMFRKGVWFARAMGWMLLLVAIAGMVQAEFLPSIIAGGFKLLPSLGLALLAVAWIAGLELFLHFFDRYLSGN